MEQAGSAGSTSTAAAEQAAVRARPSRAIRRDLLTTVGRADPEFSLVLFEDFLYALYAAAHEARGKNQLAQLAPYLKPTANEKLALHAGPATGLTEVRTVVIGALRYLQVEGYGKSPVTVDRPDRGQLHRGLRRRGPASRPSTSSRTGP